MDIISILNNEELRGIINEPLTSTEKAVAAKLQAAGSWRTAITSINNELGRMSAGIVVGAMGKQTPAHQALAKALIKGSMHSIIEMSDQMVVDYEIEQMLKEGGLLHGIESEEEILRKIADYYAEQAAKESAYYRFNTQGGGATNVVTIDLKTIPSLKGRKDVGDIKVELLRADIMPEETGAQPHNWTELCRVPWPQSLYATGEILSKYHTLDGRRVIWQSGKKKEITRQGVHLKITAKLDEAINPTLMAEANEYDLIPTYPLAAGVVVPSVYSRGIYAGNYQFNSQAAKGAEVTVEDKPQEQKEQQQPTTTKTEDGLSFPVVKEKCKLSNGNYKCPRCGQEGLRKNGLQTWQMKKLPDNVKPDDYAEQIKWSGSCICGTCRDALKNEQEQKLASVTAYEKAVAEWEQAEDAVATAKAQEQQLKDNLEALKKSGQDTTVFEASLETYRLNTQKAEAHATELAAKVDALDPNKKEEEPKAEEPEVKEPEQQQSASANAKAGVTNMRTKKGGRKGRK